MVRYDYAQVQGGYRWNMLQRIKSATGIEPTNTSDVQIGDSTRTVVEFARDLTNTEKANLDALMASNPTKPPVGTKRFTIKDIWETLAVFNTATGVSCSLYFSESVPGSGKIDQIELHTPSSLTNTQKNKIRTEYANLLREG